MEQSKKPLKIFAGGIKDSIDELALTNYLANIGFPNLFIDFPRRIYEKGKEPRGIGFGVIYFKILENYQKILGLKNISLNGRQIVLMPFVKGNKLKELRKNEEEKKICLKQVPLELNYSIIKRELLKFGELHDLNRLIHPVTGKPMDVLHCYFKLQDSAKKLLQSNFSIEGISIEVSKYAKLKKLEGKKKAPKRKKKGLKKFFRLRKMKKILKAN